MKRPIDIDPAGSVTAELSAGFPVRLYFMQTGSDSPAPLHRHRELEFVLVLSGALRLSLSGDNVEFEAGQGFMINSGVMHSLNSSDECSCAYILFPDEFIAPSGSDISVKYVRPFVTNQSLPYVPFDHRYHWQGKVLEAAGRVFALLSRYSGRTSHIQTDSDAFGDAESSCFELEVHTLMCGIWSSVYSGIESALRSSVSGNEYVARRRTQLMVEFIHSNYRDSVSLAEIAAAANISKSEASRCFQSCLHVSPVAYLLRVRIEMAQQLLQNSTMTIEAIGFECGFSSASYFCKMFQQHTGTTPGQYRKNGKNL